MDKRGINVIVSTVLIVLISVVLISVFWVVVIPIVKDIEDVDFSGVRLWVVFEGHTVYDDEHGVAFVQVRRGQDEGVVYGLDIIFDIKGSSVVYRANKIPKNNGVETYVFDIVGDGFGIPDSVKVVPVFLVDGIEEFGVAREDVKLPKKKVYLDDWDEAMAKVGDNVLKEAEVDPDVIVGIAIDGCKSDFVSGETYSLVEDLEVMGNCFVVGVDDVVLDLNGHLLNGSFLGYGVWVKGKNVTVKDGDIRHFEKGVYIDGLGQWDNNSVVGNEFFDNNNSVYVYYSRGNVISGNQMSDGSFSNIYLNSADDNLVAGNWACGSFNDIRCSYADRNKGAGNTFHTVIFCPNDWLGSEGVGYIEC